MENASSPSGLSGVQGKAYILHRSLDYVRFIFGWWFGTFFTFPYIGNNHPNWRTPSFFRGVGEKPPTTLDILGRSVEVMMSDFIFGWMCGFTPKGLLFRLVSHWRQEFDLRCWKLQLKTSNVRRAGYELVYKPHNYSCKYHKPNLIGVINQISNLVAPFCRFAIWLFNIAMERSTIFKFGKPSISMDHLYHGELLVITRG